MKTNENIPLIYPKGIRHESFTQKPKNQGLLIPSLVSIIAPLLMIGRNRTLTKIDMDKLVGPNRRKGRRRPFFLLYTHMQFIDMPMFLQAALPRKSNNVSAIDSYRGLIGFLQWIGKSVTARKFGINTPLVRTASYVMKKNKSVFGMAAEAQYSSDGLPGPIPDSVGKMVKLLKEPLVILNMHGNYANCPTWSDGKARKGIPLQSVMTYALAPEQIDTMPADDINAKIREMLSYNEWKYWQDGGFVTEYPNRAAGIEHILYKCPECGAEFQIETAGANIKCTACGKEWELTKRGFIAGKNHETKFDSPDKWVLWERAEVKKALENGTYNYSETVRGLSVPHRKVCAELGDVTVEHTASGMTISGNYNGNDFRYTFPPTHSYNIQREFNCPNFKGSPSLMGISTIDDTLYFVPTKRGMCYKIELAVQELYKLKKNV